MARKSNLLEDWNSGRIAALRERFLSWYDREKRDLPWRMNQDPYRIWISEIMLQQTRVDTVIPYYERFMRLFPTIEALSRAPEDQLLKAWEGLGYYSRARNLQTAAQTLVKDYSGCMPKDPAAILKLKGIGPYTAGAIASMAFQLPEPAVDGNVMRVFSRVFMIADDISVSATRKLFEEYVCQLIDPDRPGDFNQACMDLGSAVCTPTQPACSHCPLQVDCLAWQHGCQSDFPVKKKKRPPQPSYYLALAVRDKAGNYLLVQRPREGLLANMWTFPLLEITAEDYQQIKRDWKRFVDQKKELGGQIDLFSERSLKQTAETELFDTVSDKLPDFLSAITQKLELDLPLIVWQKQPLGEVTHLFSHLKWNVFLCFGQVIGSVQSFDLAGGNDHGFDKDKENLKKIIQIAETSRDYVVDKTADSTLEQCRQWLPLKQFSTLTLPKPQQKLTDLLKKQI